MIERMQTDLPLRPVASALSRLRHRSIATWLLAAAIGMIALLPRCLTLSDFITEDEGFHWIWRVRHFSGFIRAHDWGATNLTGHPGVTTMWLGTFGRWLADWRSVALEGIAAGSASPDYLAMLRLPLTITNALAVVAGYLLLRRLLRPQTALIAALLWATSPFIIAHSRLLHMDALLMSWMTLSVLCLLASDAARIQARPSLALLAASGLFGGLALLTKAPAMLLLPLIGLLLLLLSPPVPLWLRLRRVVGHYLLWFICAAAVFAACWPAMWVAPAGSIGVVINEIVANGGAPHHSGNYFLGQRVADPGWLFYPAVVVWRSTPFTLVGLLLLPLALRQQARTPGEHTTERRALLSLLLFVLVFSVALSMLPKKFDRYLLPIWPTLEVLAACGLVWLWQWLKEQPPAARLRRVLASYLVPAAVGLSLAGTLLWYHPYYLAYFNPLAGGGPVAQHVMLAGWGEGMEHVGAWLRTRPDVAHSPVLTWGTRSLEPFIPGRTNYLNRKTLEQPASYAVLYIRSMQRQEAIEAQEYVRQSVPPLYTLRMYGMDYAYIYQPPRPYDQPVDAVFGSGLHLRGFSQATISSTLVITPSWDVQTSQPGGLFSFVHILAADNSLVSQVDAPIDEGLFANWQAGQQFGSPLLLALPPDLPAGEYRLVLGVYHPDTGTREPVTRGAALPAQIDGANIVQLTTISYQPVPDQ